MKATLETDTVTNALGRRVPTLVNGREQTPFVGIEGEPPTGRKTRGAHSQQQ